MARFIPTQGQSHNPDVRFNPGARPADELLPASMIALVEERDKLTAALYAARQALDGITRTDHDTAAAAEDDASAADAARAGRPIPEPSRNSPPTVPPLPEQSRLKRLRSSPSAGTVPPTLTSSTISAPMMRRRQKPKTALRCRSSLGNWPPPSRLPSPPAPRTTGSEVGSTNHGH
jgi:hypothetical protein